MQTFKQFSRLFFFLLTASLAFPVGAALNAYAELTANGSALNGSTSVTTIGGVDVSADHIEIFAYSQTAQYKKKPGSSPRRPSRARFAGPITLIKAQDATSPLFYKALFNAETIEGTIKFFGNDPDNGQTRLESTVAFSGGLVTSVEQRLPDTLSASTTNQPTLDIIEIVAETMTWEDAITGTTSTWSAR